MLSVQILDDDLPELAEVFHIMLTAALSADGLIGSTNTSGASLDPERSSTVVTVAPTDHPHGLLQFDVDGDPSQIPNGTWIKPLTESPSVSEYKCIWQIGFSLNIYVHLLKAVLDSARMHI